MVSIALLLHGLDLVFHTVKDNSLSLDRIFLNIFIELFTKKIMTSGLRLWSKLFYFLHELYLVINTVRNYSLC
jgi:hypothetical protein